MCSASGRIRRRKGRSVGQFGGGALGFEITIRNAVVAVELDIVERSGNSVPARHSRGFDALDVRSCGDYDISATQRAADQNDLQFDRCAGGEGLGERK